MNNPAPNLPALDADEILKGIIEWVDIESPSHDGVAVNRMVDRVKNEAETLGLNIERTPGVDGFGDILRCRTPWGHKGQDGDTPGILVLSHLDTVHPIGIKDTKNPIRREGDKVYGPGIYDMKAGAYIALHAMRHLIREGRETPLPVTFMFIPEEEIGSPTSKAMIAEEGKKHKYVLVTEPAREGGKIVTARNGRLQYEINVKGVPAHAGVRHMDGHSAIHEMAKIIIKLEALTDYDKSQTCSVGIISGGTLTNVVPEDCQISVDIRQYQTVPGGKPLLSHSPAKARGGAKSLAAEIGFDLQDLKTGGGSDGNFTGALGIPTLDGLGADGHGAHSNDEYIYYSSLVERCRLMVRLMETLD